MIVNSELRAVHGPLACLSSSFCQPLRSTLSLDIHYNSCISTVAKVNAYRIITCSSGFMLQSDWCHQVLEVYGLTTPMLPDTLFLSERESGNGANHYLLHLASSHTPITLSSPTISVSKEAISVVYPPTPSSLPWSSPL